MAKSKLPTYRESIAEITRILAETARMNEATARRQEEITRRQAETDRQMAETDRLMKELRAEVSGVAGSNGEIFEIEAAEAIKNAGKVGAITLNAFTEDVRSWDGNQYDLVGINGKYVVLMEVKHTLRRDDITRLAKESIPALKADFPANVKGKTVKGALIYRRIGGKPADRQKTAREALARGIILMRAIGKNKLHHIKTPAEVSTPARQLEVAK